MQLLRLLREPLLLAAPSGEILGVNVAAADALGASVSNLEGAAISSFASDPSGLGFELHDGGSFPVRSRDGRRWVCDASALATDLFLLRISGGPEAEPRARGFFETLSRLHGLITGYAGTKPLEDICLTLLSEGMRTVGAIAGGVFLLDNTGANLEMKGAVAYPAEYVERYRLVPLTAPIPLTDAVKRITPVFLGTAEDYSSGYPEFTRAFPYITLRAMACIPLELDGRAIGVLGLGFPLPWSFSAQDRGFLRAFALQLAHVLHRARQVDADEAARVLTDRAASRLALLYGFTEALAKAITPAEVAEAIVDKGLAATSARAGGLWLLTEDGAHVELVRSVGPTGPRAETFRRVPLDPARRMPILDAIQRGAPVWLESCRQIEDRYPEAHRAFSQGGESSLACIPLFAQGRSIGGLAFNYEGVHPFLEDERAFLQMLGWHAAQAIERSRLYAAEQLARRQAEGNQRRSEFLADIGVLLSSSLDYASMLSAVARATVPRVADWCIVELEDERLQGIPPASAHVDPSKEELALEASRRFRALGLDSGIPGVIRAGRSELYTKLDPMVLRAKLPDPELVERYAVLGVMSSMVVPIVARGRTFGAILCNSATRNYDAHDLAMAEELGRRVGIAVENARLYREAREADRLKDQVLAMVSHELRHPLAPIVTTLGLMEVRDREAFAAERAMITRNIQHVVRLVDDLLDVARITNDKVTLTKTRFDLAHAIDKAIEMANPLVVERRHRLSVRSAGRELPVSADEARLTQAIANLLTNAAKYTEPGGRIDVSTSVDGMTAVVRVRDSGIGIAPELLPTIFDMFVQEKRALDRAQGGMGIGLTVVKRVVELHGGVVYAHSAGLGQGTELVIELPLAAPLSREMPIVVPLATPSSTPEIGQRQQLRVLIVDDNEDAVEVLQDALAALGCAPEVAHDGPSALAAAERADLDLALLDIGLPVMDGYELARRLRALRPGGPRLVALTGYGQASDLARSREAGFDEHIVKPVTLDALRGILARCL
ncbi:MAG: GAF domain-containing protein [Kofleriaceae bacterium]|nr:GAF domain-containing protein [Kofleriaceae bacterium]